jgi:hypothetical protein
MSGDDSSAASDTDKFYCPIVSCKWSKTGFTRKDNMIRHIARQHPAPRAPAPADKMDVDSKARQQDMEKYRAVATELATQQFGRNHSELYANADRWFWPDNILMQLYGNDTAQWPQFSILTWQRDLKNMELDIHRRFHPDKVAEAAGKSVVDLTLEERQIVDKNYQDMRTAAHAFARPDRTLANLFNPSETKKPDVPPSQQACAANRLIFVDQMMRFVDDRRKVAAKADEFRRRVDEIMQTLFNRIKP